MGRPESDQFNLKPVENTSQYLSEAGEETDATDIRYGKDMLCGFDRGADCYDVYG